MSLTVKEVALHAFSKQDRLNTAPEYANVFKGAKRSTDALFTVLVKETSEQGARLGLAIAKKSVKKAVQRNRIKRVIRETFRQNKNQLKAVDLVVLCRHNAAQASKVELAASIKKHWAKLIINE
ncbi:MAG: ribonuclease P protein component [Cycloclasticus sp.]|nr:ribonuclease P protein component [Cycloclasticus sp.]